MVYNITYRRPSFVPSSRDSLSGNEKRGSIDGSVTSGSSGMSHGIPDALSFDRIIAGGVCPPCTVRDFMNYLKYIELSAENLQFFLWYRDYVKRFNETPAKEQALAPEWTEVQSEAEAQTQGRSKNMNSDAVAILNGTDFAGGPKVTEGEKVNPFYTPPRTPSEGRQEALSSDESTYESTVSEGKTDHAKRAEGAFQDANLKWKPLSIQPYREEITRIISIYIADGGSRQLNLSSRERASLLHALQNTTHPSAFREVITTVEWSLRCQAHPNFIRWTICNGNRPRVIFARGLGIGGIVGGLVAAILITLSSAGRGWRVLSFIGFMIGISTLIAAWKGMCVVLHGMHHRHLRPWELFASDDEPEGVDMKSDSIESLASANSSNSWENEPWVAKYEKRNLIRKVFDREVWVQEPALRQIQDTIFLQAILGAFVISAVSVGIFCAFPKGNFF
ncbi:uncharacterized protein BDZ99DRAFT_386866 [Mytilinidion resinicola]|uniref:Regulator of G protein signaling superfamily n=1 Tax=Mytilinidion resinicola TaxID=574789 RepID=A0A6A6YN52_9PEZI|nr:uncharacterized protein BDZ99DRAFT_386866 [Mytilinidion resinicola]KAF2810316.1 hypothetical protein BDZ99DRAFT_386866 [Mytilinidion resinicola]